MKNKKCFKYKKLIVVSIIICVFVLFLYLFMDNSDTRKTQIVNCYLDFANYSINQKAKYVNETFTYIEVEQKINVDTSKITISLDNLKNILISNFENQFKQLSSDATYFVEIEDNTLIFGYNMTAEDYKKLETNVGDSNETLSITDNFYDDKNRFIQNITKQGGQCTYE